MTTILVYHSHFHLSTLLKILSFFKLFHQVFQPQHTIVRTGFEPVTAVKRRCLNPLTNGPELLFNSYYYTVFSNFVNYFSNFFIFFSWLLMVRIVNSLNTMQVSSTLWRPWNRSLLKTRSSSSCFFTLFVSYNLLVFHERDNSHLTRDNSLHNDDWSHQFQGSYHLRFWLSCLRI